jgi:hypothetical protein
MVNPQEQAAMKYVKDLAEEQNIKVEDKHSEKVGYDYRFTYPDGKTAKVEVKGTEKEYKIPDMSDKEFDSKQRLKADFILVVGHVLDEEKILYKIPREAIKPGNLRPKQTYHIKRYQNRKNMGKYIMKRPYSLSES